MAFRRKFRRFPMRRRRSPGETYTVLQCSQCTNVMRSDATCQAPIVDLVELFGMKSFRNALTDTTEFASGSDRAVVVKGIKFQSEFWTDPASWSTCQFATFPVQSLAFMLKVWEAVIVLPYAQGSQVPAYVPDVTNATFQSGDLADRVLWKRISIMPMWGTNVAVDQLEHTVRDFGHGPIVIKSRVRLDDRHGLFYVKNFVHDIVVPNTSSNDCFPNCDTEPQQISVPVNNESWWKIFATTRK